MSVEDLVNGIFSLKLKKDILLVDSWKTSDAFKNNNKETQIKYYRRMGSDENVLQLVDLDSKPFGTTCENIIKEIFELSPRTSSQNDCTRNGRKIEIKSARYWAGQDDCKWQHLEPDHDYEFVLFVLLDFDKFKVWIIEKRFLMGELRERKVVTYQGKQGWWVKKSDILVYLFPVTSVEDIDTFINDS